MNFLEYQRPGLTLLSASICRRGTGSYGSVLLAEHLLHCHHRLGSLLPVQLLHCGESRAVCSLPAPVGWALTPFMDTHLLMTHGGSSCLLFVQRTLGSSVLDPS